MNTDYTDLIKQRTGSELHPRIVFDNDLRCVVLAVDRELHVVSAGFERQAEIEEPAEAAATASSSTTTAAETAATTRRTRRRIATQVPLYAIYADILRAGDVAHDFAGVIGDRD